MERRWAVRPECLMAVGLLLLCPLLGDAQRGRRGAPAGSTVNAPPLKGVVTSFHGKLKQVTKKTLLLQTDDDHLMAIRRSRETKFLEGDKVIKASDLVLESAVTIDATEDTDLKLLAVAVKVDPAQKKRTTKSR